MLEANSPRWIGAAGIGLVVAGTCMAALRERLWGFTARLIALASAFLILFYRSDIGRMLSPWIPSWMVHWMVIVGVTLIVAMWLGWSRRRSLPTLAPVRAPDTPRSTGWSSGNTAPPRADGTDRHLLVDRLGGERRA